MRHPEDGRSKCNMRCLVGCVPEVSVVNPEPIWFCHGDFITSIIVRLNVVY